MKKTITTFFMLTMIASNILIAISLAQSTPSIQRFRLKYVDNSYDVTATTSTSTDPYTCKTTTVTTPGYHVENKTVMIKFKNKNRKDSEINE